MRFGVLNADFGMPPSLTGQEMQFSSTIFRCQKLVLRLLLTKTTTSLRAPIIHTFLWGQSGNGFGPSFTNRLARTNIDRNLKNSQDAVEKLAYSL